MIHPIQQQRKKNQEQEQNKDSPKVPFIKLHTLQQGAVFSRVKGPMPLLFPVQS